MRPRFAYAERSVWSLVRLVHEPGRVVYVHSTWHLSPRCNDGGDADDDNTGCVTAVCYARSHDELHIDIDGVVWLVARLLFCPEVGAVLVTGVAGSARWRHGPRANLDTLRWDARIKAGRRGLSSPFRDAAPLYDLCECVRGIFGADLLVEPYTPQLHEALRRTHSRTLALGLSALPSFLHASVVAEIAKHTRPAWFAAENERPLSDRLTVGG